MCGRYSVTSPGRVIAEIFAVDEPIELAAHYNLCPGQDVPVVRARHGDGGCRGRGSCCRLTSTGATP